MLTTIDAAFRAEHLRRRWRHQDESQGFLSQEVLRLRITAFQITWISAMQMCFQPTWTPENYRDIKDQVRSVIDQAEQICIWLVHQKSNRWFNDCIPISSFLSYFSFSCHNELKNWKSSSDHPLLWTAPLWWTVSLCGVSCCPQITN